MADVSVDPNGADDPVGLVRDAVAAACDSADLATRVAARVPRLCLARPAVVPTYVPSEPVLLGATQSALAQARASLLSSLSAPSD